ncbi:hypothetical protein B9Z55_011342 [Caenorhabditis nigoni]|uniref:Skp1-related protein n=1 Tax=Caenorhabditis nigoni TaxID=1611254 RepID=A0A2G5UJM4_9PELO|nr:hypothetical protein B9Z55_011342 [Caenorhabditis nigoni]
MIYKHLNFSAFIIADQAAPAAQPAPAAAPKPEPSFYFNLESCDKEIVQISDLAVPQMITIHNLVSGLGYDAEKAAKDVLPIDNVTGATLKRAVAWCEHHRGELLRYCCKKIAMMAQGKTPDELRVIFEIPTDEEDAIAEKELKERLEREAKEEAERGIVEGPSTSTGKR